MTYLVTGCAGFIGWKVTEKLLQQGEQVVGIDNMNDYYDPCLKQWRLEKLKRYENFIFQKEDIVNYEALKHLFKSNKFGAVFNLAARAWGKSKC